MVSEGPSSSPSKSRDTSDPNTATRQAGHQPVTDTARRQEQTQLQARASCPNSCALTKEAAHIRDETKITRKPKPPAPQGNYTRTAQGCGPGAPVLSRDHTTLRGNAQQPGEGRLWWPMLQ